MTQQEGGQSREEEGLRFPRASARGDDHISLELVRTPEGGSQASRLMVPQSKGPVGGEQHSAELVGHVGSNRKLFTDLGDRLSRVMREHWLDEGIRKDHAGTPEQGAPLCA